MTDRTIPLPVIPVVAEALKDHYSESKLRGLFRAAGVEIPVTSTKMTKVELCMACLTWLNKHVDDPLSVLGGIIGDLMDREAVDDEGVAEHRKKIASALLSQEYTYARGGHITMTGPTLIREIAGAVSTRTTPRRNSKAATAGQATAPTTRENPLKSNKASNKPPEARMAREPRPTMFIGSTVEALPVARAVHAELDHDIEVTIWNHSLFPGGVVTWSQLLKKTPDFDFALFIFSGDDQVISRDQESFGVRDNVLVEYGLFVGALGHERVFFMFNRDARPKVASDLAGVTPLTYANRNDGNFRAAISPGADDIRQAAVRLGRRVRLPNPR